jgi:hypothetical protein
MSLNKFETERIKFIVKQAESGTYVGLNKADADIIMKLFKTIVHYKTEISNLNVLLESWMKSYDELKNKYEPTVVQIPES